MISNVHEDQVYGLDVGVQRWIHYGVHLYRLAC